MRYYGLFHILAIKANYLVDRVLINCYEIFQLLIIGFDCKDMK